MTYAWRKILADCTHNLFRLQDPRQVPQSAYDAIVRRLRAISRQNGSGNLAFDVVLRYGGQRRIASVGTSNGKPASAISGHPDIPWFLLLDDPADELFLSAGLGAGRILISIGGAFNRGGGN